MLDDSLGQSFRPVNDWHMTAIVQQQQQSLPNKFPTLVPQSSRPFSTRCHIKSLFYCPICPYDNPQSLFTIQTRGDGLEEDDGQLADDQLW